MLWVNTTRGAILKGPTVRKVGDPQSRDRKNIRGQNYAWSRALRGAYRTVLL